MNYLSVCSGIEAATVGWHSLGWQPVAFSEIEKFPCSALAHHYPDVPNWGDMTKFKEWPDACRCVSDRQPEPNRQAGSSLEGNVASGRSAIHADKSAPPRGGDHTNHRGSSCEKCGGIATIDVLVGGTPCQSFSVAGLRKGLDDPRGNLMLTYLAIAAKYRPRWLVWENVPGVLSSNGGRDFASLLRGMAELGYGFAYRILDAQHFGVPQRRRRVFVVGHLGSWQRAAAVLFERHSLQGHPAPRREAGKGFTHPVAPSLTSSGRGVERGGDTRGQDPVVATRQWPAEVGSTLNAHYGDKWGLEDQHALGGAALFVPACGQNGQDIAGTITAGFGGNKMGAPEVDAGLYIPVTHALRGEGFDASEDGTGRGTPLVPVAIPMHDMVTRHAGTDGSGHQVGKGHGMGIGDNGDPMFTLGSDRHAVAFAHQADGAQTTLGYDPALGTAPTLSKCQTPAVAWSIMPQNSGKDYKAREVDVLQPLMAAGQTHGNQGGDIIQTAMQVRRLTPVECSRLQGFPDDYLELAYANADEAHAAQVLHELWREARTPVIEKQGWRTGIVAALLTPEILLSGVHGGWLSWEMATRCAAARGALSGEEHNHEGFVRALRQAGTAGRSPFGRESFEQFARELGSDLSILPLEGASARKVLRSSELWSQAQARWPLRYAFAKGKTGKAALMTPDGPRYKALGNSMAVPVMAWIGKRIQQVEDISCTTKQKYHSA